MVISLIFFLVLFRFSVPGLEEVAMVLLMLVDCRSQDEKWKWVGLFLLVQSFASDQHHRPRSSSVHYPSSLSSSPNSLSRVSSLGTSSIGLMLPLLTRDLKKESRNCRWLAR